MRRPVALVTLALATLVAAGLLSAGSRSQAREGDVPPSVLQMNLCLSGVAGCYAQTSYPSVVDEAEDQVASSDPATVTLNEVCSRDAEQIARHTGYRIRFAPVLVRGAPLPCVDPTGRGVFGIAVLARDRIETSQSRAFSAPSGPEERRWLCATTARAETVCTAHLDTRGSAAATQANDLECTELRGVLAGYAAAGVTVFGGDVNRHEPCAPDTMWAREDVAATQAPGIQHIYGSSSPGVPSASVAGAAHTDHDYFAADVRPLPAPVG